MGKKKILPWDPIKGLDTAEDIVIYLDVLLEEGDMRLFKVVLEKDIVLAIERYGISVDDIERVLERVARQHDYVREHVDYILAVCRSHELTLH